MRIAGFGTYDTGAHPRVAVLLEGLAAHGHEVREINAPWAFDTAARVKSLGSPLPLLTALPKLLAAWFRLVVASRRGPRPDVVVVGHLGHLDVLLARVLFRRATLVLDLLIFLGDTARDRGAKAGLVPRVLDRLDRVAIAAADVVVVDTDEHRDLMPARHRDKTVVVPVGAPQAWFDARENDPVVDGPLQVVFFGLFTPLQGAPVIAEALERAGSRAALKATMIGSGQDLEAAKAAAPGDHIRWIDRVASTELPAVVAAHDVCLGIVGTSEKGLRVVPNKVYQGAAAGCVVVTSDTAPQRRALGDDAVLVPPGDAEALADALVALAGDRERLATVRAACSARADRDFRPAAVVRPLLEVLS
ncbi:glycosyltransferase [Jatrophihabitans sp. YIM 134969]